MLFWGFPKSVSFFWLDPNCLCSFGLAAKESIVLLASPNQYRSFGLTQKNQKVKAAPAGLLRFAAGGKWMKLASLKQHPFLVRLPRRSASRPAAEAGPFSSAEL